MEIVNMRAYTDLAKPRNKPSLKVEQPKTVRLITFKEKRDNDGSNSDKSSYCDSQDESLPEIEARAYDGNVLIRIHCVKKRGIIEKIVPEIENLHLSVLNTSVLTFGTSILDITLITRMDTDFTMSTVDLVKHVRDHVFKLFK